MQAAQVVRLARNWVENYGSQAPGFCGACLTRGINTLLAIETDEPDEERPRFRATFGRLLEDLGLATLAHWQSCQRQGKRLADGVFGVADDIIGSHPDIYD
jgi:hypothetical protein